MATHCKSFSAFLCSLLVSSIVLTSTAAPSNAGGFTVDLIHRDSRQSPSYNPSDTRFQRIRSAFSRSFWRKSSLLSSVSRSLQQDSIDAPITPGGGEFLLTIKIGSPPVEQLGIADTGSDLTWMQCKPCKSCYKQNLPIFNPSKSSSYRSISCQSAQCDAASAAPSCDTKDRCQYEVSYGDQSVTYGDLAAETLTLAGNVSFPKFVFGCGHVNNGTFSQTGSGIVGLGGGSVSIIKQLRSTVAGRFSYCLTLLNSNATSKMSFGNDAVVAGPKVVSTPLVKKSPSTFYYLTLEGVSVGKERTNVKASPAAEKGNIIIDSGTTLTFVPAEIYEGIEAALVKAIKGIRVPDPEMRFGLCYQVESGGTIKSPPITAHFTGADLVLAAEGIFVEVAEGLACLTFAPSGDLAIFGNLHQGNYRIGYDLVNNKVSFQQTDCSKLH